MADDNGDFQMSDYQPPIGVPTPSSHPFGSVVEQDARMEAQQTELRGVRQLNSVIEGVVSSLEKANRNMEVCCLLLRPLDGWMNGC